MFDCSTKIRVKIFIYRFQSDEKIIINGNLDGNGFLAMYDSQECSNGTECMPTCRDYSSQSGLLTSPFYPKPYPDKTECTYTITQAEGTFVNLTVLTFEIYASEWRNGEWQEAECGTGDYLEIRDGDSEESPLMGRFCGTSIPQHIASTENHLWMR